MTKIYLASPFFDDYENLQVEIAETVLRDKLGFNVFSPRENQLPGVEFGSREWRTDVFRNDVKHIHWCDYVFMINKAFNDDTGTAWEAGYAYALGKPLIVFNPTGDMLNLMVTDSLHAYFESWDEVLAYDFKTLPIKPYKKEVI